MNMYSMPSTINTQPQTSFTSSLAVLCCGGCRKNNPHGYPQNHLLNPSVSNNYLYQQHLQQLQQQRQQQQIIPSNQLAKPLLTTATTVVPLTQHGSPAQQSIANQQRYVGDLQYVMQQQHPIYHQSPQISSNQAALSPSRNFQIESMRQTVFTKQPLLSNTEGLKPGRVVSDLMIQPDSFRRISGLTSEVFRQIEAVEAQFDPTTLAAQYSEMERRGDMIIRILSPTQIMPQWLDETIRRFGDGMSLPSWVQFVEIIKRPGQTLGLYIREGDGVYTLDGVYISRIALESPVYQSGCLRVGDEVLAINFVDVSRMSLDDVVLIMSIPRRLVLTIRSRPLNAEHMLTNRNIYGTGMSDSYYDTVASDIYSRVEDLQIKPVVVLKQQLSENPELDEDEEDDMLAAATAAAEAGILDADPALVAKAAAAVAAVNELNTHRHQRSNSIDVFDFPRLSSGGRRKLYSSDNLAELYQKDNIGRGRTGSLIYDRSLSRLSAAPMRSNQNLMAKSQKNPAAFLYHGRLSTSRSRSLTGRLMRTASEQMLSNLYDEPPRHSSFSTSVEDQLDYFLQRYNTLKQSRRRNYNLERSGLKNSLSSQSLVPSFQRHLETMGIPLPAMAEAAARRRMMLRESGVGSDTDASMYDHLIPTRRSMAHRASRSNSLPRGDLYGRSHQRSALSQRLQELEQFYGTKKGMHGHSSKSLNHEFSRPHSAIGNYRSDREYDSDNEKIRKNLGLRMLQQRQNFFSLDPASKLEALKLEESKLSNNISRVPSTSAIYETIRKSKMAQDSTQPHSGSLISSYDDMKHRFGSLQQFKNDYNLKKNFESDLISSNPALSQRSKSSHINDSSSSNAIHPHQSLSSINLFSDRPNRPLMIDPSGFQQYCPDIKLLMSRNDQVAGFSGLFVIHLLGVRGLQLDQHFKESISTSERSLYCVVECDRVYKARTVAVQSHENNTLNFDWDEIFDIDLFDTKEITFLFYTWNQSARHKLCSKGTIYLPWVSTLQTQHVHAFEMRLYETPGAMLYIKLEYHDIATTFKRIKKDSKPSTVRRGSSSLVQIQSNEIFGISLETVLAKENSGFFVPIIIKRCTEEIERRGLHLVGIYRLCGSSIRKRNLRESFEKNAWLADLAAETVPDINVVTSLLKDYLRELPEPLFNKALFDMMDDGLSVCVPDDPAGNAKLMFSILECLSEANRNTVLFMMDHIKLIHLNSERNKMTSQALAICFGPLFSCHSQSESLHKAIQVFKFLLDIWPHHKGSFNSMKKFEDFKLETNVVPTSSSTSFSTTTASDRYIYTNNSMVHPKNSISSTTKDENLFYDSPSRSNYRFETLPQSTSKTRVSSIQTTSNTTWTTTSFITNTTWSSSVLESSGSGRMLPSTHNATRTISAYSPATNSVSQYKVPPGATGPSKINKQSSFMSENTKTENLSNEYGDTYSHLRSSTGLNNTSSTLSESTYESPSKYKYADISFSTPTTASYSRSSYLYSSDNMGSDQSEVIDQTYKKYLTSSASSTSSINNTEAIYSTVNKPNKSINTGSSYRFNSNLDSSDSFGATPLDRKSYLDNNYSNTSFQSSTPASLSSSIAEPLENQKPLIGAYGGKPTTQLYPTRLNSVSSSAYSSGFSSSNTSTLTSSAYSSNSDFKNLKSTDLTSTTNIDKNYSFSNDPLSTKYSTDFGKSTAMDRYHTDSFASRSSTNYSNLITNSLTSTTASNNTYQSGTENYGSRNNNQQQASSAMTFSSGYNAVETSQQKQSNNLHNNEASYSFRSSIFNTNADESVL